MEEQEETRVRPVGWSIAIGAAVGLTVGLAALAVVYAPIYMLARSDPSSLDRPSVRDAMFRYGLPLGVLAGVVVGVIVGLWYRRGGHLPTDRPPW